MGVYEVVKFYQGNRSPQVIVTGLTRQEAERICQDPDTSSMTARKPKGCDNDDAQITRWHDKQKHWFYGFREY